MHFLGELITDLSMFFYLGIIILYIVVRRRNSPWANFIRHCLKVRRYLWISILCGCAVVFGGLYFMGIYSFSESFHYTGKTTIIIIALYVIYNIYTTYKKQGLAAFQD